MIQRIKNVMNDLNLTHILTEDEIQELKIRESCEKDEEKLYEFLTLCDDLAEEIGISSGATLSLICEK
jgi:hypothetical protein